jgi:hypothetical protein
MSINTSFIRKENIMPTKHEDECYTLEKPSNTVTVSESNFSSFINTDTISTYFSSLSPSSNTSWTISFGPEDREITIRTEASFMPHTEELDNAEIIEECLREKVAADLARQLLDEDLIQIQGYTDHQVDGSTIYKMKAEVKIIQE